MAALQITVVVRGKLSDKTPIAGWRRPSLGLGRQLQKDMARLLVKTRRVVTYEKLRARDRSNDKGVGSGFLFGQALVSVTVVWGCRCGALGDTGFGTV
jgi:hypothetical protein